MLTVNISPFSHSSSTEPHYMQVTSDATSNYGFKYKVEYLKPDNTLLHTQYLAPNSTLANGVRFNLHEIMGDYVEPNKYIPNNNYYIPDNQLFKYKVKVTEEYLKQTNIIDHLFVTPYGNDGKTVIKTSTTHGYSVGDLVYIEITSVTGGTTQTQKNIKESLTGIRTVTNVLSTTEFAINVPFPDSSATTTGVTYYADNRKSQGSSTTTSVINVLWSKNSYEDLFNSNSIYYKNNYSTIGTPNTHIVPLRRVIYPFQIAYNNILEYGNNNIIMVKFISKTKEAYYTCFNMGIYKSLNVNPEQCTLSYTTGTADPSFLTPNDKWYKIQYLNNALVVIKEQVYEVNNECAIFDDQLIFIDYKGNMQSFAVTLQKTMNATTENNQHRLTTKNWTNDFLQNTYNTTTYSFTVNTDWMDYLEYKYSEQLLESPYIWYKQGNNEPRPCTISEGYESISSHNTMYRRNIKINLY